MARGLLAYFNEQLRQLDEAYDEIKRKEAEKSRRVELCRQIYVDVVVRFAEKLGVSFTKEDGFVWFDEPDSTRKILWPIEGNDHLKLDVIAMLAGQSNLTVDELIAHLLA